MELTATALPALGQAMELTFQANVMIHLVLGVVMGLCIGIFPGLGGIAGLSLLLPFMFGMEPMSGLALMIGLVAVVPTSDTFASVLMGIPGSSASQATVLDGFPLAKRGEAARALSAAFASSLFGGLFGAFLLTFFILIARPIVLEFRTPELLMITAFGLSMVGILAGRIAIKGIVAAGLGLLAGTVGEGDSAGALRMASYDLPYLTDGFKLVIVGLGIFAIPEIVALLRQDRAISDRQVLGGGWLAGARDWLANIWLSVRCSAIGVIVGVIPGLGGSVVDWIAYGHAVMTTRDTPSFGSGNIRGVIGPESSNNAKEGGGLVPTLLFGIPGSGSMAIFIGAVALLGSGQIEVGPSMIKNNLDVTDAIVWMLALANVVGTLICIAASGGIARITTIPFRLLAPFLFMIIAFAAFQSGQSIMDLVALFGFGMIGIMLRRFDWSRPAFLIGFVLSNPAETYTNQAVQIAAFRFRKSFEDGIDYLVSPIVIVLIIMTAVSVILGLRQARNMRSEGDVPSGAKRAPVLFLLVVLAYLLVAFVNASLIPDHSAADRVFPRFLAAVSIVGALLLLVQMIRSPEGHPVFADRERVDRAEGMRGLWPTLSWFAGLLFLTTLTGFIIALTVFLLTYFRLRANQNWAGTLLLAGAGILFICTLAGILNREFPPGLLQEQVHLPWPLR
ncbi:MAG: tripartite tricarboxylate transporter permease [Rhodobacteraceae bacterium]|nr:tripartite tricarboxylate transporter permease [Paracoccaceae bacterium]